MYSNKNLPSHSPSYLSKEFSKSGCINILKTAHIPDPQMGGMPGIRRSRRGAGSRGFQLVQHVTLLRYDHCLLRGTAMVTFLPGNFQELSIVQYSTVQYSTVQYSTAHTALSLFIARLSTSCVSVERQLRSTNELTSQLNKFPRTENDRALKSRSI